VGKSHFFTFVATLHNYNYEGYMCVHVVVVRVRREVDELFKESVQAVAMRSSDSRRVLMIHRLRLFFKFPNRMTATDV